MKQRILVTGGAGFIGSHLCEALLKDGHFVLCLDNLLTGVLKNIAHLRKDPNFEFVRHDVTQPMFLQVDQIYHLACPASPPAYQLRPVETIRTGVIGTMQVMELAKRVGARVLLASTSEIYGDPEMSPQIEDYFGNVNPIGPRACYDESKRCAEAILIAYKDQFKIVSRIARLFNTYGPRLRPDDGRVVSNFICQSLHKKPITVYGDGSQTRSFCYVSDTVQGLVALMNSDKDIGPINIGNPVEITIKTLASKILYLTLTDSQIHYRILPQDDPKRRCPDISKAKRQLNWTPKIDLDTGLKKTILYFCDDLKLQAIEFDLA